MGGVRPEEREAPACTQGRMQCPKHSRSAEESREIGFNEFAQSTHRALKNLSGPNQARIGAKQGKGNASCQSIAEKVVPADTDP